WLASRESAFLGPRAGSRTTRRREWRPTAALPVRPVVQTAESPLPSAPVNRPHGLVRVGRTATRWRARSGAETFGGLRRGASLGTAKTRRTRKRCWPTPTGRVLPSSQTPRVKQPLARELANEALPRNPVANLST